MEESEATKTGEGNTGVTSMEEVNIIKQLENLNLTEEERKRVTGMDDEELKRKDSGPRKRSSVQNSNREIHEPGNFQEYDPKNLAHGRKSEDKKGWREHVRMLFQLGEGEKGNHI